nr:MAG TPA: hypothetical protein [Caudoviricetes sp.]
MTATERAERTKRKPPRKGGEKYVITTLNIFY